MEDQHNEVENQKPKKVKRQLTPIEKMARKVKWQQRGLHFLVYSFIAVSVIACSFTGAAIGCLHGREFEFSKT